MNTTKTRTTVRNVPTHRANIRSFHRDMHDVVAVRDVLKSAMLFSREEAEDFVHGCGNSFVTVNVRGGTIVCSQDFRHEVLWMLRVAARSYFRIMNPIWHEIALASVVDAAFDGGEWSGPAHGRWREREEERVAAMVAERFGITAGDLYAATMRHMHNDK